jgi:hypothetical protein
MLEYGCAEAERLGPVRLPAEMPVPARPGGLFHSCGLDVRGAAGPPHRLLVRVFRGHVGHHGGAEPGGVRHCRSAGGSRVRQKSTVKEHRSGKYSHHYRSHDRERSDRHYDHP